MSLLAFCLQCLSTCPRLQSLYKDDFHRILSLAIHSFTKYQAHVFHPPFFEIRCFSSNRSVVLATKAGESQYCQEIEPADNTERFKKNFSDAIFSANSGPSNLYRNKSFSFFIRAETSKS